MENKFSETVFLSLCLSVAPWSMSIVADALMHVTGLISRTVCGSALVKYVGWLKNIL